MSASTTPERKRTFSWDDPLIGARVAATMSGLEFLQAIERGELPAPPIMLALNIGFQEAEAGRVVFSVEPAEYHYNPIHAGAESQLRAGAHRRNWAGAVRGQGDQRRRPGRHRRGARDRSRRQAVCPCHYHLPDHAAGR